jgi:hypothetical protein
MLRWWKTLGRADQIALLGILVTLIGIVPTYLVFFQGDKKDSGAAVTTIGGTKAVTDALQALTVRIPENWGHIKAAWDISYRGEQDVGTAIQAGSGSALHEGGVTFSDPSIIVGASAELAKRLQFSGRPESDLVSWSRATESLVDWSKEGCVLVSERDPVVQDFVGTLRVWENCNGLVSSSVLDYMGVSRSGSVVLYIQELLPPRSSKQMAEDIIQSVVVREEKLPRGAPVPVASSHRTLEVPTPRWLPASSTTSGDNLIP